MNKFERALSVTYGWFFEENTLTPQCREAARQQIKEDTKAFLKNKKRIKRLKPSPCFNK